ncbi:MAG: protein-L-isoaspartate O-methyltransferase [Pseudoruegeria sp.]
MPNFESRRTTMVDTQVRPSDVTKFPIIEAMLSVPRELFVPRALTEAAYIGENLEFAPGRVLLEPRTLAKMLDALDIQSTEVVLDVGCGQGYSSALIARIADAVIGIEQDADQIQEGENVLTDLGVDNVVMLERSLVEGAAKHGPYDVITVQGAVETIPTELLDQLKEGGRIGCLFRTGELGELKIGYKVNGVLTWRLICHASAPVLPGFEAKRAFEL